MGIGAYASARLTVPTMMKKTTLPNLPGWPARFELGLNEPYSVDDLSDWFAPQYGEWLNLAII